jgi:hypothetical protein
VVRITTTGWGTPRSCWHQAEAQHRSDANIQSLSELAGPGTACSISLLAVNYRSHRTW